MSVQLPAILSDGMVLQRNTEVKIWGTSHEPVTVTFLGEEYNAMPDNSGRWEVLLFNLEPGGPYELKINKITIKDVYVGDVWLCSGQSNMEMAMDGLKHMYPDEFDKSNPNIRQFIVPQRFDFKRPLDTLDAGCWKGASPETIREFTAVGYFFAQRLYEQYRIPIGLIHCAVGGTPIHAWMSKEALRDFPELICEADMCTDDYIKKVEEDNLKNTQSFFNQVDSTDPGLVEEWYSPDFDDSQWEDRELLTPWTGTGSFWFRKTIDIPPELEGKPATLFLGTIVDWDVVYVNGVLIGNTTYRYPPREYRIPSLPKGKCVIAIRVISNDGGYFTPGKQYLLTTDECSFNLNGVWKFKKGGHSAPPKPLIFIHYKPTGLYNGMISPIKPYKIKGAIWYQGESDAGNYETYKQKFTSMVQKWRNDWGYVFPFLFVELAHWAEGGNWHLIRRQQIDCLDIPNTAMAAAFDLGEHNDLHPLGKKVVGERLARCAMRVAYGEKMPHSPFEIVGYHKKIN